MTRAPCISDYRGGDEMDPRSPWFDGPDPVEGSEPVEFAWTFYFDPPHPALGDESPAILKGSVSYEEEEFEHLSMAQRRKMTSEDDPPVAKRAYGDFAFESAELPDGSRLDLAGLLALPGFGSKKDQFDAMAGELRDCAQESVEKFIKVKKQVGALREEWRLARTPSILVDVAPRSSKP